MVEIDGAHIHTQTAGTPHGRPLVFLHGGLGTLDDFDPFAGAFDDCHCVFVDSRGHGASTLGAEPLSYPRLAADVEAVISAYGLDRPVIIGHSDGGIAAIHVAAGGRVPLGGLVTLAAHADPPHPDLMRTIYASLTAAKWRAKFGDGVALYERLNPEPDFDRVFAAALAMWRNTASGNFPGSRAAEIRWPALILAGDADHLVPRDQTLELARAIPGASLGLVPFGSHVVHQEQPEVVTPFIRAFLAHVVTTA
jgi:pimeloyl-ACP methyl ester carboxylesterase